MKREITEIANAENIRENIDAKKSALYGYDLSAGEWRRLAVNENGESKVEYAKKITVSGDKTYIAVAPIGTAQNEAKWQVKKIAVSGGDTVITWADGNANFDNEATDLTILTYS